ncbi:tyrosine-protein phosphatase non-receptor type 9-like [Cydia pomonella]|uniref:tyrosine-protein phosphatase non-receptor type 9-like n=1 Tax=Cydia pomonella TaxID=82600 RepID=UPI002ADD9F32|nr:tyrosine-protein phosphatase non-receptor type 9-like [Cydia pomonella]
MDFNLSTIVGAAEFVQRAYHPDFVDLIFQEHSKIIAIPITGTCENFHKPENKNKNRFSYFPCWDITRVVLAKNNDGSDYINANFIDGFKAENKFIATEQPIRSTLNRFYSMVWQQNSRIIVQLTSPGEASQPTCVLRDFIFKEEHIYLNYYFTKTISSLTHIQTGEKRTIYCFKFLDWPENGAPDVKSFLDFLLVVNKQHQEFFFEVLATGQSSVGPIVVHGMAGVGRTATFCAADYCLYQLVKTGTISIPSVVLGIKMQRNFSFSSKIQYLFLNYVLLYFISTIRSNSEIFLELRSHFTDQDTYLMNLKIKEI